MVLVNFGVSNNIPRLDNEHCVRGFICGKVQTDFVRFHTMVGCFVWMPFVMICLVHVFMRLRLVVR